MRFLRQHKQSIHWNVVRLFWPCRYGVFRSEFGKLGLVCVGSSPQRAKEFYDKVIEVLNYECC